MNGVNGVDGGIETGGAAGSNIVCGKRPLLHGMPRIICTVSHRNDIDWTDDFRKLLMGPSPFGFRHFASDAAAVGMSASFLSISSSLIEFPFIVFVLT
jgi:hypothetical protein